MTPAALPDATESLRAIALVCLWAATVRRFWRMRRSSRDRTVLVAVAAVACAMTVVWTPLGAWLVGWTGVDFLDDLLKRVLGIVAFAGAFGFAAQVTGGSKRGVTTTQRLVALVAIGILVAAFALAARPHPAASPDLVLAAPGDPFVTVYGSTFFVYLAVTMVAMLVMFFYFGLQAPRRLVRIGSFLNAAGCLVGLVYALMRIDVTVRAGSGRGGGLERMLADEILLDITLCTALLLIIAGIAVPATAQLVTGFREQRALEPLWRACCAAHPEVALSTGTGWMANLMAAREGTGTSRYRRVIEIRDGQRRARGYLPPAVVARARQRLSDHDLHGTDLDAATLASELRLSWQAMADRAPRAFHREPGGAEPETHDLDGEVRWLSRVSAMLEHPAVADVVQEIGRGAPRDATPAH